jgi:predicted ArsR family transcriptional regulator
VEIPELAHTADAPTRERVAAAILELGPSTAVRLAERLDLTPAAIRRHLEHMLEDGTVEAREPRVYGARGRGRPARMFALTEAGRDHFDQQYDDLASDALRFLVETAGEDAVVEFARRRVAGLEVSHRELMEREPDLSPSAALAKAMTQAGYAASVRDSPIGEQLCQQHCPVSHVAHEFPSLCEAETELIGRVLGRHVQRLATIAHGDGVCTTSIPPPVQTTQQATPRPAATHPATERKSL